LRIFYARVRVRGRGSGQVESPEGREQVEGGGDGGAAQMSAGPSPTGPRQATHTHSAGSEAARQGDHTHPACSICCHGDLFPRSQTSLSSLLVFSPRLLQKQQREQLDASLLKAQNALRSCDHLLTQLKAESDTAVGQLISWQRLRDE